MLKTGEIFMSLFELHLKTKIAIRALAILKEEYPKLELDFLKYSPGSIIFYDKVEVLVSKDKTEYFDGIQAVYETIYQNQFILEVENIIKKLTK